MGFNKPGGYSQQLAADKKAGLAGVGCEDCHNPGSEYEKVMMTAMSGKFEHEKAMAAGLAHSTDVFVKCRNQNSPFHKEFDVEKSWEVIKHGEKKKK